MARGRAASGVEKKTPLPRENKDLGNFHGKARGEGGPGPKK